jgi:tripartite-type tricarboxylate transporter receptor subunit TctC
LSLGLRLGEGSGAALALGVVQAAVACHSGMATFAEAGVSDFEALAWFGFVTRQGTPPDVLNKMSELLQRALKSPDVRDKIAQSGDVPAGSMQEFAELLGREHVRWERTVKAANIKPE